MVAKAQSKARFGYVTMATKDQAQKCISELNRTELKGSTINVELVSQTSLSLCPLKVPSSSLLSSYFHHHLLHRLSLLLLSLNGRQGMPSLHLRPTVVLVPLLVGHLGARIQVGRAVATRVNNTIAGISQGDLCREDNQ